MVCDLVTASECRLECHSIPVGSFPKNNEYYPECIVFYGILLCKVMNEILPVAVHVLRLKMKKTITFRFTSQI